MQLSYPVLMDMDISEILWWHGRLHDIRVEEVKQLNKK